MGRHPLIDRLTSLLQRVYHDPMKVKSDYARKEAEVVAMAASLQLITTQIDAQCFARSWRVTTKGLAWLNERNSAINERTTT